MIEKKFEKQLNKLTLEEQKKKEECWKKIELETGLVFDKPKKSFKKYIYAIASCCVLFCIMLPIIINGLQKNNNTITRFSDTQYILTIADCDINTLAENNSNILNHNLFVQPNSTKYYVDIKDNSKLLGVYETAYNLETKDIIIITILFDNVLFEVIEDSKNNMILYEKYNENEIYYQNTLQSNLTYFKYNNYTYFIECYNASSETVTIDVAKMLISSK